MPAAIYSYISKEKIKNLFENFYQITGLGMQLSDNNGALLMSCKAPSDCCRLLEKHVFCHNECSASRITAGQRALELGEGYIFACPAELNCIAFPLVISSELLATIIAGPFLMDDADSTLVSSLKSEKNIDIALSLELYDQFKQIPVVSPVRVNHYKTLIDNLFSPLILASRQDLLHSREKAAQQARISEAIRMYKDQGADSSKSWFYDKETLLMSQVRVGNLQEARALLNELIGFVLFSEGRKLESIRIRAIELTSLLSRVALEGGASAGSIYEMNTRFLSMINSENDIESLCILLQEVVEGFVESMFPPEETTNRHVRTALSYMAEHYADQLTLKDVADVCGITPTHLSMLFSEKTALNFRQHLNRIRIEESKRLLLSSDYSVSQIALSLGYNDQSYFCKVFKNLEGMPPGEYRNRL